jgi:hypothetical protein
VATKPQKPLQLLTTTGAMAVSFILPLLPHTTYLYYVTSNPVFPLYNKIFQSPLWSYHNTFDVRWGPQGVWQTIFWPFGLLIKHDRVSELNLYSGRLTLGLFALFLLLLFKREERVSQFGFVMVTSSFLWSLGTGYMRYGLCLEIFGGISLVLLANQLWKSGWASRALRQAAFGFVCLVLFTQSILAAVYSWDREWGGRPVGFLHPKEYRRELGELFSDRSLTKYLTSEQMDLFKGVEGLVEAGTRTSAVTSMLRPDLPQLNIFSEPFLATPAAMRKFRTAKSLLDHKILLSVVLEEDLELAIDKLQKRGYASTKATRLQLPFFSNERFLRLVVLQITGDPSGRLGHSIFHAQITVLEGLPERMKAGEQVALRVKVKNFSGGSWPAEKSGKNQVTLGNKWLNESGGILVEDDGRTALPNDLPPGAEIELNLKVRAPLRSGDYILFLDLVQEQVSWFYEQGSTPFEAPIRVER